MSCFYANAADGIMLWIIVIITVNVHQVEKVVGWGGEGKGGGSTHCTGQKVCQ